MMLNDALSATEDVLFRKQLQKLRRVNGASASNDSQLACRFRVHGWRWHHLGIIRDLTRLESNALSKRQRLCSVRDATQSAALRAQMYDALQYIIRDNWALHNLVERTLFIPWVMSRPQNLHADTVHIMHKERQRLQRHAQVLHERVWKWSEANSAHTCESELQRIVQHVQRLRRNASLLFHASEQLLIPRVTVSFSEAEQLRFNATILKHISAKQARVSLVIFKDAVELKQPVVADAQDARNFERDVPGAIRKVGVPFWRKRFVADKVRFITEE